MTESTPLPGAPENPAPSSTNLDSAGASAGALLRQLRQAAGMDAGALAVILKVPVRKIQALEADRLEQLPNLLFARSLAGAICRALRADASAVLARMPAVAMTVPREQAASINQPFRRSSEGPTPMLAARPSSPRLILMVVLLAGAALLMLWPTLPVRPGAPLPETADEAQQDPAAAPSWPSFEQASAPALAASQAGAEPAMAPTSAPAPVSTFAPARSATASAPARRHAAASAPARSAPASAPALGAAAPEASASAVHQAHGLD
ncbi:MAG: helix-turn-helix domain-containing protein [Burkholderiaceae bacterium]|nr:helix-turn-helix domain-containing protein [Burkholderiaceae bacterium]